eukprot:5294646-Amphidinium_carterae.1
MLQSQILTQERELLCFGSRSRGARQKHGRWPPASHRGIARDVEVPVRTSRVDGQRKHRKARLSQKDALHESKKEPTFANLRSTQEHFNPIVTVWWGEVGRCGNSWGEHYAQQTDPRPLSELACRCCSKARTATTASDDTAFARIHDILQHHLTLGIQHLHQAPARTTKSVILFPESEKYEHSSRERKSLRH